MTAKDFDAWIDYARQRLDLVAPVDPKDLLVLKKDLAARVPAGIMTELVIRGSRVEVVIGCGGPSPVTRWLEIKGEHKAPGLAAMINARAAGVK